MVNSFGNPPAGGLFFFGIPQLNLTLRDLKIYHDKVKRDTCVTLAAIARK